MPKVQSYGGRQVAPSPLPAARQRPIGGPDAFGAGIGEQLGRIGQTVYARQVEQERRRLDEAAQLRWEAELSTWENERLYSPEGAFAQRGEAAFQLPAAVERDFAAVAGRLEAGLANRRQREAFARARAGRAEGINRAVWQHVTRELQRFEGEELDKLLVNGASAAIANAQDFGRVALELQRAEAAIRQTAPKLGMGPEQLTAALEEARGRIHVGVIERLVNLDKDRVATVYFEEVRDGLSGEAIARLEKVLAEGSLRGESQRMADAIIATGAPLAEQLEEVRAIDDSRLRDAVQQRVEHEGALRDRADRQEHEDRMVRAGNLIDAHGGVDAVPRSEWARMTVGEKAALEQYARRRAEGDLVTNWSTYYALLGEAGDQPEAFGDRNLMLSRPALADTEFKQLASLQLSLRQGRHTPQSLEGFRTRGQILDDTLSQYGINPNAEATSPEGQAIAQLRRMMDLRVEEFEKLTGRRASPTDIQTTLDALMTADVEVPGLWRNIWPGGRPGPFGQERIPAIGMTPDRIPAAERRQIEAALQQRGRPVSDATVLDLYLEHNVRLGQRPAAPAAPAPSAAPVLPPTATSALPPAPAPETTAVPSVAALVGRQITLPDRRLVRVEGFNSDGTLSVTYERAADRRRRGYTGPQREEVPSDVLVGQRVHIPGHGFVRVAGVEPDGTLRLERTPSLRERQQQIRQGQQ